MLGYDWSQHVFHVHATNGNKKNSLLFAYLYKTGEVKTTAEVRHYTFHPTSLLYLKTYLNFIFYAWYKYMTYSPPPPHGCCLVCTASSLNQGLQAGTKLSVVIFTSSRSNFWLPSRLETNPRRAAGTSTAARVTALTEKQKRLSRRRLS